MTSERWREIERLYHAALDHPAGDRPAFLASACGADEELRREVASLLAQPESNLRALDSPAMAAAAQLVSHPAGRSMIGHRIRGYELVGLLGAGGMGEVYRARDSRLGRDVAVKILPSAFKADPGRVARFEREAQVLAALKHPHIGAIYGLEETDDVTALVMELVEGEDLAARLTRGPLPVTEALTLVKQIADALDAAHEQGVIHRDLKPANIRVQHDGTVKVLDFGLAKPLPAAVTNTPTLTAISRDAGAVIGTPAYMSPEQARGEPAGREADIWALGVVLYELLTGISPFARPTVTETLAAVLTSPPDDAHLPPGVPASVRRLLRRCLEKDRKRRWRHMGDVRIEIDDALALPEAETASPAQSANPRLWQIAAVIALMALAGLAGWLWPRPQTPGDPVRLMTMLPQSVSVTRGPGLASSVAVSPDGRTLVIAGSGKDGQRLYRRSLDQLEPTPLAGTERGSSPFFSPDGAWIGFFADGRLKRVPVAGGAAVDIVAITGFPAGASWGANERVIFAAGPYAPLQIVAAHGGEPERLPGIESSSHPEFLPDGKTILFEGNGWIHAFDLPTSRKTRLVEGRTPRYAIGYVLLSRGTTLLAAPFDSTRHELTGPVVPLVEDIAREGSAGGVLHYAVSSSGTLAYVPSADAYELAQVAPDGTERVVIEAQRLIENPRFSRDGRSVVVASIRRSGEPVDLWLHDLAAGTATRLTFNGGRAPVWTPGATTVTYSHLGDQPGIYTKSADGSGDATRFHAVDSFHWLVGWTPDRGTLAYGVMEGTSASVVALHDNQTHRVVGPGSIWGGRLSPDGRWLAYYSQESGNFEVYVTHFPSGGTRFLIADGTDPAWSPDGNEIYFRNGGRLMAARIERAAGIRVLSQRVAVEPFLPPSYDDYDIHPDGKTLVLVRPANRTRGREVTMVLNWYEELKRLAATK